MFPKGTIYKRGYPSYGFKRIAAPLHIKLLYQAVRGTAAGLIAYSVIFFIFTFGPLVKEEISYNTRQGKVPDNYTDLLESTQAQNTTEVQEEARKHDINSYFSVVIPKIEAKANIIANVDAASEKEYTKALSEGVAHAAGTYFPGQGKRVYLFSHSTNTPLNFARYNAVFYLLTKLEAGDEIVVFFADKKYVYQVTDKKTVEADDTSWLTANTSEEELVLQTCDPPGTTWKRLIVTAKPVEVLGGR